VIVLAGKGHEKYEITADGKKPFDEEKIVTEAVKRRR
jgi:UDP-N-acetylmuramyl tripeptide synthase